MTESQSEITAVDEQFVQSDNCAYFSKKINQKGG